MCLCQRQNRFYEIAVTRMCGNAQPNGRPLCTTEWKYFEYFMFECHHCDVPRRWQLAWKLSRTMLHSAKWAGKSALLWRQQYRHKS